MKKLVVMVFLVMLVGCGQTFEEKDLEFMGNITVESKHKEDVAIFKDKDGNLVNLFWSDKPKELEKGALYKIEYQTNENYTNYLRITNYDKR